MVRWPELFQGSSAESKVLRYKVKFDPCFISEKTEYEPGESVTVKYPYIATDTSYNFFADADDVRVDCDGCVATIRFTMPDHDVEVSCTSRNTMRPDFTDESFMNIFKNGLPNVDGGQERVFPPSSEAELPEGKWECKCCGAINGGKFCSECGSPKQ
ncbi:MAG: hypothetical protein IKP20_05105 [Candidatus Methanomethylophilaceae archaeon]|nr:hypothetical protein [Candidatus Methanomethylophilaceae archaeon]